MHQSTAPIRAAQARWELNLTVLQEEERRLFALLEEQSRKSASLPQDPLDRLKAARAQCNEAFSQLMEAMEERIEQPAEQQVTGRQEAPR